MRTALLSLLSLSLLAACSGPKNGVATDDGRFGGPGPADSLFFSLERTPCFGMCPSYRIHVYRSGYATWEGMGHVEKMGLHRGRIGRDTLEALLNEAERIGYFGLEDKYDGPVTDLPSTLYRMVSGERDKAITARYKVPRELKDFGRYADSLLVPVPWRPVGAAR